ncbi:hypothetical protein ADN00_00450 [Ornatilinea apprima]|uniref:Glycosyltransferase subfamily 4-like N-terminal domain-containing protein n=1 Tax=Ornatilinea apprima TaxID=1134406 RepID=A0A0P6XY49_9CHLR|nr:glycosyltransferase family 4 protein [Ornatilinea apprima]KPL81043.1 hypothetical protein ADN00_00450 [Ornatilinea apprima]
MRILFLSQIVPWPLDAGPKIKSWNVLQHLKEAGHEVWFVSFVRAEEEKYIPKVKELLDHAWFVPIRRSRINDLYFLIKSRFTGKPFLVERDHLGSMRDLVKKLIGENHFDILHADQLTMAQFFTMPVGDSDGGSNVDSPKRVFDAHNATWKILERAADESKAPMKWFYQDEMRRLQQFERKIITDFDHTFTVSEIDKRSFLELSDNPQAISPKITPIPIGINSRSYERATNGSPSTPNQIVTLGSLNYPPNADGIRWFIREVYPFVLQKKTDAFLWVIGKNPPSDFFEYEKEYSDHLKVTGYVDDLDSYFNQAALAVVPVKVGGGMRVRILECFARNVPVITTTIGAEGIEVSDGDNIFIEDEEEKFAQRIIDVLGNEPLRHKVVGNAKDLLLKKYDWSVVLRELERVYCDLVSTQVGS